MAGKNNGELYIFLNRNAINTQGQGFFKTLEKIMSGSCVAHISCFLFPKKYRISFSGTYLEKKSSSMNLEREYAKDYCIQDITN